MMQTPFGQQLGQPKQSFSDYATSFLRSGNQNVGTNWTLAKAMKAEQNGQYIVYSHSAQGKKKNSGKRSITGAEKTFNASRDSQSRGKSDPIQGPDVVYLRGIPKNWLWFNMVNFLSRTQRMNFDQVIQTQFGNVENLNFNNPNDAGYYGGEEIPLRVVGRRADILSFLSTFSWSTIDGVFINNEIKAVNLAEMIIDTFGYTAQNISVRVGNNPVQPNNFARDRFMREYLAAKILALSKSQKSVVNAPSFLDYPIVAIKLAKSINQADVYDYEGRFLGKGNETQKVNAGASGRNVKEKVAKFIRESAQNPTSYISLTGFGLGKGKGGVNVKTPNATQANKDRPRRSVNLPENVYFNYLGAGMNLPAQAVRIGLGKKKGAQGGNEGNEGESVFLFLRALDVDEQRARQMADTVRYQLDALRRQSQENKRPAKPFSLSDNTSVCDLSFQQGIASLVTQNAQRIVPQGGSPLGNLPMQTMATAGTMPTGF